MQDLDKNLWEMGIASKTKHNEAAPAQHELAPEYSTANIACDHNQLIMETMRTISKKHGLACLLHEKPFANVNGSGKHNNFSLCTDTGENLLKPGKHPENNLQFLLMLCAFLRGVDLYATFCACLQLVLETITVWAVVRLHLRSSPSFWVTI